MKTNRILITGGTGRLAFELKKNLLESEDVVYVGIENWDFIDPANIPDEQYDLIVHMGAYTDVKLAETESLLCFDTNVKGTFNMVQKYKHTPFIYISTEWAHNPLGVYALTKQLGEEIVKTCGSYLILRTLFKPNPYPFDVAYSDEYTQGDYVDVIAKLLSDLIKETGVLPNTTRFLGTNRKTIFELAQRTRPDVKPNSVDDYNNLIGMTLAPKDYL